MRKLNFLLLLLVVLTSNVFAGNFRWTNPGGSAWRTESDLDLVQVISPEGLSVEVFTGVEQLEVTWVSDVVEGTNAAVTSFADQINRFMTSNGNLSIVSVVVVDNNTLRAVFRGVTAGSSNVFCNAFAGNFTNSHNATGSTFQPITVTVLAAGTLPVELMSFTAEQVVQDLKFDWTTASELNSDFFLLEEEITPGNFVEVPNSFTEGAGNSTEQQNYSFTINSVTPGVHYYRLKQVDFDGFYSYSDIVAVDVQSVEATSSAVLEIRGSNLFVQAHNVQGKKVEVLIVNTLGQVASIIPISGYDAANGAIISTGDFNLGRGIYAVTLSIESSSLKEVKTIKFIAN